MAKQKKIIMYNVPLADVVPKYQKLIFNYPKEKIWNQKGVSLQRRIDEDKSFKKQVDKVITADNLVEYVVPADDTVATRCIDGRITSGWQKNPAMQNRALGPKVAGGTVHAALAHRVVDTEHLSESLRFEADIKHVVQQFKDLGIGFGGHIDDHQAKGNTGCGAVDNINLILDRLQRPEHQQQLRGLTQLILGEAHDARYILNEVIGRMLYLDALKPSYMPKVGNDPHGEFLYKKLVVKTLREQAGEDQVVVPALSGPHNEVAAVLNFIPKTTFDTDRFSNDNENQIQVFAWDVWHMFEEARRLFPYDMTKRFEDQLNAVTNRMKYVTTRTLLGVSTMMVLTDGSLSLAVATGKH